MKKISILITVLLLLANCKVRSNSNVSSTDDLESKYGIKYTDTIHFNLSMFEGENKVWPYFVMRADVGVDLETHREYNKLEVKKFEFSRPVWDGNHYVVSKNHTFTGREFIEMLESSGKKAYGNRFTDIKTIYLDIYNNNTSFSSVDTELFKGHKIELPISKIGNTLYLSTSEQNKTVEDKIKQLTSYKKVSFVFQVTSKQKWDYKCSGATGFYNSKKAEIFIAMNEQKELKNASIVLRGNYDRDLIYVGKSDSKEKFSSNTDENNADEVVLISEGFLESGALLLFRLKTSKQQYKVNLNACEKL